MPLLSTHDNPGVVEPLLTADPLELAAQLGKVAAQATPLLIVGETGTGKSRLARLIHEWSPRRDEPFLVVECGSGSPHQLAIELFGLARDVCTASDSDRVGRLAAAGRGTLVLDEIAALPLDLQGKLLRATEDHCFEPLGSDTPEPFHARVIVVSSVPLDAEVQAGRFRADLNYRLNVVAFRLPPLRENRAAILPLAHQFVAEFAARQRAHVVPIGTEAARLLQQYAWPGNIRELRNTMERAVMLTKGDEILPSDLPASLRAEPLYEAEEAALRAARPDLDQLTLSQGMEQVEILRITQALHKHGNHRGRAAAELGISRMSLYKKLHKYRLMSPSSANLSARMV